MSVLPNNFGNKIGQKSASVYPSKIPTGGMEEEALLVPIQFKGELSMLELKMSAHDIRPGAQVVEIWNGSTLMGVIYPTERGVKVLSKYILHNPEGAIEIDREKSPSIPAILINLR